MSVERPNKESTNPKNLASREETDLKLIEPVESDQNDGAHTREVQLDFSEPVVRLLPPDPNDMKSVRARIAVGAMVLVGMIIAGAVISALAGASLEWLDKLLILVSGLIGAVTGYYLRQQSE